MREPIQRLPSLRVGADGAEATSRVVPDETAVAFVYDGATYAVMMATPSDLDDYAVGFSLSERQIADLSDIAEMSVEEHADGVELRMWLSQDAGRVEVARRRRIAGPTGCGLCGVESLAAALPAVEPVQSELRVGADDIRKALASLAPAQSLNAQVHAVHAAGLWTSEQGLVALREDVGRHNALDKLVGATVRSGGSAAKGIVVLTSRVSVEMVQKAAVLGAPVVVAVSAPTALAVRTAQDAGIMLIAVAREDSFEVFTHAERLLSPGRKGRSKSNGLECYAIV